LLAIRSAFQPGRSRAWHLADIAGVVHRAGRPPIAGIDGLVVGGCWPSGRDELREAVRRGLATNILFGNIFGVSGSQLVILLVIGLVVMAVMGVCYRPLLYASVDPDAAEARGVPVGRLGLMFMILLALSVTGAAQVVGTLLVLSLAITPAAAAQRLSARPLTVAGLSILFAVAAADGGLLASFQSNVKASVFITTISFAIYVAARLAGPLLRDRRRRAGHQARPDGHGSAQASPALEPSGPPA
jgi:ABC 3 transport family